MAGGKDVTDGQRVSTGLLVRGVLTLAGFLVFLGIALFLAAGDVRWAEGWAFLLVFFVLTAASIAYLWRTNPDIFVARSRIRPGTKGWDKVLVAFLLSSFLAIFPVAGLDAGRFHWSSVSLGAVIAGYGLLCVGFFLSIWVYRVNRFAEPTVRIQTERGHKVIDTGPYALVRHPLYLGALWMCIGIPLALGSLWALGPAGVGIVVLVVRTVLEDRTLQEELEGYREYASRVRYRLIPGVW
jgi:protein-S-isoprenylcysteine O-methyltransferase Ste14